MNRISRLNERRILDLYFQGFSRDAIAPMVGVVPSTASEVIKILPESLTHLRELSVELRKQNLSVFEAKKGAELRARLDPLGVKFEKLQSFVESTEKMSTNPDYEPKQIVQSAMKLNELEKYGKTYLEALVNFEEKNDNIRKLETKEHELTERVEALEIEKKRKLAENNVMEREIVCFVDLRQNLRRHGVELSDASDLLKYLQNMKETGMDPKQFVEYARKHGSLEKIIAFLEQEEHQKKLGIQSLQKDEQNLNSAIGIARSKKIELDRQVLERHVDLDSLQEERRQTELRMKQELSKLSVLLMVEPAAEKVVDALGTKQKELEKLNAGTLQEQNRRQDLRQQVQELENRVKALDHEIQEKVRTRNHVTELAAAIADLERQKLSLEKENNEKRERQALADTIANFFTRSPYDFDRFCHLIELVKTRRKAGNPPPDLQVAVWEEEARTLALKVFKGDIVSRKEHEELRNEEKECIEAKIETEARVTKLEAKLGEATKNLERALDDKRILESVKANFEGRSTTLGELRNWVYRIYGQEIEKRANEKLQSIAAGVVDVGNDLWRMITHKDSPVVGGQS